MKDANNGRIPNWEWTLFFALVIAGLVVLGIWPEAVLHYAHRLWDVFSDWSGRHLFDVTHSSQWLVAILPSVAMLILALILQLVWNRPPNWLRPPIAFLFLLLQVNYLIFRLAWTLSFENAADGIVSVTFFLSELLVHTRIAIGNFSLLHVTDRSAQADESERAIRAGEFLPTVDVFLPTYSEPVELLRRTIVGCQAMDYPKKTIWLLDDTRRPEMRKLAEELGCRYLDRPDNRHAKAGNLNHALQHSEGELIVFFDADFVPDA